MTDKISELNEEDKKEIELVKNLIQKEDVSLQALNVIYQLGILTGKSG